MLERNDLDWEHRPELGDPLVILRARLAVPLDRQEDPEVAERVSLRLVGRLPGSGRVELQGGFVREGESAVVVGDGLVVEEAFSE